MYVGTLEEGSRLSTKALMRRILVTSASVLSLNVSSSSSFAVSCLDLESNSDLKGTGLTPSILLNLCLNSTGFLFSLPHSPTRISGFWLIAMSSKRFFIFRLLNADTLLETLVVRIDGSCSSVQLPSWVWAFTLRFN